MEVRWLVYARILHRNVWGGDLGDALVSGRHYYQASTPFSCSRQGNVDEHTGDCSCR